MGGEDVGEEKTGGYMPWWWKIDKAAWREAFPIIQKLKSVKEGRTEPLPPWSNEDVDEFIKSDPVHGPRLKLIRQGAKAAAIGSLAGGIASASIAFRHSKSSLGAVLAFGAGAASGWALTEGGASLALGLYKFDCIDSNLKFLQWWQSKTEG